MSDGSTVAESAAPARITGLAENLWFPALFFFGFLFCYLLPFHSPEPHHVKVAVSPPAAAAAIGAGLDARAPGTFDIIPASDAGQARRTVLDRHADAAYAVAAGGGSGTLYTARADGVYTSETVNAVFTPIARARHTDLSTVELVPTAPGDVTGTGLFHPAMTWNLVPCITVMMLMRATSLSHRAKLLTLAAVGVFVSVVGSLVAHAMDAVPGKPLAILYGFLATQAVAWTVYGLIPFVRQYIPGVAMTLFVLLSIPSSGGVIPWQMVPGFFRWLHPVLPLGNLVDALRGIFYFGGKELLRPTLVIGGWILLGMALVAAGALHRRDDGSGEPGAEELVEDPVLEAPTTRGGPSVTDSPCCAVQPPTARDIPSRAPPSPSPTPEAVSSCARTPMPWDATRSPACPRTSSPSSSQPRTGYPRPRGSDWPVTSADPLAGIHVAVNRAGHEAPPGTPLLAAGQALPLPGALPAYTAGSAWINHVEHLAGTIRTGMRADLVVLDRDPFEGPAEELAHARVDRIYVDGQLVHRSG